MFCRYINKIDPFRRDSLQCNYSGIATELRSANHSIIEQLDEQPLVYLMVWLKSILHSTTSFIGNLSGWAMVRCVTTQVMSLPSSVGCGASMYSLWTVTVLSRLFVFGSVVAFPLSVVDQDMVAAGRPLNDSQRATMTGVLPAVTVTILAVFFGLAVWEKEREFDLYLMVLLGGG